MTADRLPFAIVAPPDAVDSELEPLLSEPFASAWATDEPSAGAASGCALRGRLLERASASRVQSAVMVTSRLRRLAATELASGVQARTLYAASRNRALRPGEPVRARLIELRPGSRWHGPDAACHHEWLVLRGSVHIGDEHLARHDYHVVPQGAVSHAVVADADGARLFLRESVVEPRAGDAPCTVRDADTGWPEFAPGIRRRVLWQRDGLAALLYHARAGAAVPMHTHGHDEECLMVQGELFLDDELLQQGDYQIAPAGTGHRITATDTGVVIYAHGDLDLNFVA